VIKSVGFQQSKTDYTLFTRQNNSSFTAFLIYVDDILLTGNDLTEIQRVKDCLLQQFRIKDLGDLKYFIGIEFSRSKAGIYMSQRKYALDILQDTRLTGACPDKFPMEQYLKLTPDDRELLKDPVKYRRLVGRLIYLTVTRPDLAFSVQTLSQYIQSPRKPHWDVAIRVLKYFTGTRIAIAIREQSDIDSLLRLKLGRLSDNSEISIWVLHFSWFFYYLMEVKKTDKRIKIISESIIPRDGQYLFGDSLVAISVTGFKGAM